MDQGSAVEFDCPRVPRAEGIFAFGMAYWRKDQTCSHCGSMSAQSFFAAIERGDELGPTDKSYKVYVGSGSPRKFYFQHLSEDGKHKFIELLNSGAVKIGVPGRFYVLPYFVTRATADGT